MTGPHKFFKRHNKSGQTMLFLIMLMLIMAFIVMWNFDLHKALTVKQREQNAGDAAALAAARWQGISLNLIGDLTSDFRITPLSHTTHQLFQCERFAHDG